MKLFACWVVALTLVASNAFAAGRPEFEIAAKLGGATKPVGPANSLGFGAGARMGLEASKLYFGLTMMHYIGSDGIDQPERFSNTSTSFTSTLVGFELGYTFTIDPEWLLVRPQFGLGVDVLHASSDSSALSGGPNGISSVNGSSSDDQDYVYLEPGLTLILPLGVAFVAADINALLVPSGGSGSSKGVASLAADFQVGIRL